MSYPRTIQPLVIEDETCSKEYFECVFNSLGRNHSIAPPHWAFCHEDAKRLLAVQRIYHVVTIDLRLPEKPSQPASESLDFGMSLIKDCATRNEYPIPAVLVISGHVGQTSQQDLAELLESSFPYGRVLVKSAQLKDEIERALQFVERYCDVGIHVRDGGNNLFPTITPREEDLLRQAVLTGDARIGLDLAWWSALPESYSGWTKILMGKFLLSEGRGVSLYTFFKLASESEARTVFQEAEFMNEKLKHVKVMSCHVAGDRSLLVTQSVGSGTTPPQSLDDLLSKPNDEVADHLKRVAQEIVQQVAALGDRTPEQRDRRLLLWKHHEGERLESQWNRRGGPELLKRHDGLVSSPIELFASLAADETSVRYEHQSALPGDLNYTNVAVDFVDGSPRAFIFDASGSQSGASMRDIAMLEVTTLLHQKAETPMTLACASLYEDDPGGAVGDRLTDRQSNTVLFIQRLREAALQYTTPDVYALMVLDHGLIQLGGLDFGSSFNKIVSPRESCLLAGLAAKWYERLSRHS